MQESNRQIEEKNDQVIEMERDVKFYKYVLGDLEERERQLLETRNKLQEELHILRAKY